MKEIKDEGLRNALKYFDKPKISKEYVEDAIGFILKKILVNKF